MSFPTPASYGTRRAMKHCNVSGGGIGGPSSSTMEMDAVGLSLEPTTYRSKTRAWTQPQDGPIPVYLIPKNNNPRLAFSTSSSNARPSLAVHHVDLSISSAFFPLLIADSNATLRALRDAIRRGSEWPVNITTAVRAGRDV